MLAMFSAVSCTLMSFKQLRGDVVEGAVICFSMLAPSAFMIRENFAGNS